MTKKRVLERVTTEFKFPEILVPEGCDAKYAGIPPESGVVLWMFSNMLHVTEELCDMTSEVLNNIVFKLNHKNVKMGHPKAYHTENNKEYIYNKLAIGCYGKENLRYLIPRFCGALIQEIEDWPLVLIRKPITLQVDMTQLVPKYLISCRIAKGD